MDLGKRIKALRKTKRLTQQEFAKKAGINFTYVGKIEKGQKIPSVRILGSIARTLGVPLDYLIVGKDVVPIVNEYTRVFEKIMERPRVLEFLSRVKDLPDDEILMLIDIVKTVSKWETGKMKKSKRQANTKK